MQPWKLSPDIAKVTMNERERSFKDNEMITFKIYYTVWKGQSKV